MKELKFFFAVLNTSQDLRHQGKWIEGERIFARHRALKKVGPRHQYAIASFSSSSWHVLNFLSS